MDRRRELAGKGRLPATSTGAALFADISGFTNLTEVLSRNLGPRRGAEELTRLLDQVFGPITSAIHEHGGSVISFGGDSVTSWFDGDDGSRATAAAISLRSFIQVFRSQETGGPASDIDIKVAVVSGQSRRIRVGRPEHSYMDVLAGEVVESLSSEAEMLQRGEVAVSREVAEALGFRAEVRTISREGQVRFLVEDVHDVPDRVIAIDDYAIDEPTAREWLLPNVHEQIEQRLHGLMAELREVVAVFVGFEGIDHVNDDDAGASLDTRVSRVQEVFGKYDGVVLQVLIDDKGCHLYAVFGASISHEDEARRAVRAALELTEPSPDGAMSKVRVGIASGVAYVGSYGGPNRMTYGAHGPVVSLAARIMQQTPPGEVHVTAEIAAGPSARVDFVEIGPREFKGIDRAVTIHRAAAANGHGAAETSRRLSGGGLVGRDRERGVVASRLAQLHAGEGGTVLIEGPAGIGKSRLLKDFVEQAELLGTTIITSTGEEIESSTAFYAWRPVLRQLFGGEGIEAEEKLLAFVANDPWLDERKGLLAPMVSVAVEDSDLIAGMESELRGENTLRLLTAIVRGAPRPSAPFVIVIDDGHWVDSASWAMAERAVREIPALLLVIATRPFGEGSGRNAPVEYERLIADERTEHVVLTELEPAEVMQLVEQCLGVTNVPGPVVQMIIEQAEGHPYFSEEIAFALRDAGLLVIENGESRLAANVRDLREVDFPNTVQDIIIGRFDRLSARQQSILKVASVIGREFSIDTLVEIYPVEMEATEAVESLSSLVVLDLMQEVVRDRSRYRFRHAITRDIAYGLLLFSQKTALHRAVAISLETAHSEDLDAVATTLAYHWRNSLSAESDSGDVDKALYYLGRAGRTSLRNFAHREAIGFLTDAIHLATPGGAKDIGPSQEVPMRTLAQMEQDLAEAYLGMGRVDRSADHFERSLQLHGYPVGHGKFGVGARLLAASALQARHRLSRSDVSAAHAGSREDLIEAATAYERLMKIYYYANDPGALITAAVSGLNLAEKAGTSPVLARIYANMSIVAGIVPIHRLARLYARRSREVADEVDRPPEHAWVRLATSVYGVGVGDWETTENDLRDSLDLYKRLGDTRQMEETLGTTGQMMTAQGRFVDVYAIGEQLRESGAGRDDAQGELWGWLFQGTSLLRQGDYRTAMARFRNGEALLDAGVGSINVGWLYGLMAETYWRLDDQERARAAAASASQALYAERPGVVFALDGFTGVADVYLGQWATGRAREAATAKSASELAVKKLGVFSKVFPIGQPASHRYAGEVKAQAGDVDAARKEWEQGLEIATDLVMPYEEGRLRLSLGRLSKDRAQLKAAQDLFEVTGAVPFSESARAALREV